MVLGAHVLCVTEPDVFLKLCPKNGENGSKMGQECGFLDLLEKLVINFFRIWSIKKVHIICCILALIPYLEKMFPVIWVKMFLVNQIAGFLN